jgi:hypothetical protein
MLSGYSLAILFDGQGYPLQKQSVIKMIGQYYNMRFIPILLDNQQAFANVVAVHRPVYKGHQPQRVELRA